MGATDPAYQGKNRTNKKVDYAPVGQKQRNLFILSLSKDAWIFCFFLGNQKVEITKPFPTKNSSSNTFRS